MVFVTVSSAWPGPGLDRALLLNIRTIQDFRTTGPDRDFWDRGFMGFCWPGLGFNPSVLLLLVVLLLYSNLIRLDN